MAAFLRSQIRAPAAIPILIAPKVLLSDKRSQLSQNSSIWGCVLESKVRELFKVPESQLPDQVQQGGRPLMEKAANIGEITCVRDATTGDYSLSMDGAIAVLAAENERLQRKINDLLNKIECLRCCERELGSA
jgi:hypothetical protein